MTTYIGNAGRVKAGSNIVAEVRSFTLQQQAATADSSALSDSADVHQIGTTNWSGTITCWYDTTDTNGQELMTAGASITLGLYAIGTTTGKEYFSGTGTITQVDLNVQRNTTVEQTFQFKGNGVCTRSTVP